MAPTDLISRLQRRYDRFFAMRPGVPLAVAAPGGAAHTFGGSDPGNSAPLLLHQ
ncbi:MAG TPA: hypothetical protein VFX60_00825 [Micromonospora sp.]|nr:hypothetical protein [Micromonospora sp.]